MKVDNTELLNRSNFIDLDTPVSQLSPETQILLYACKTLCNKETASSLEELIDQEIDWKEVLQLSYFHGLAPILYYTLNKLPQNSAIPMKILGELRTHYYQTMHFNMRLYNILNSILKTFKKHKLALILIKGPILAEQVYPNIALRPISDIDLLIKKEEADRIHKVLRGLDYRCEPVRKWLLTEYYCLEYYRLHQPKLEIHWKLFLPEDFQQSSLSLSSKTIWENVTSITINGNRTLSLSDELNLLYLCLHMAKHFLKGEFSFIWACDIALILNKKREVIDWTYFEELAEKSGQRKLVCEVLQFIERCLCNQAIMTDSKEDIRYIELIQSARQNGNELHSIRILKRIFSIPGIIPKIHSLLGYFFPNYETIAWKYKLINKRKIMVMRFCHPFLLIWRGIGEYIKVKT